MPIISVEMMKTIDEREMQKTTKETSNFCYHVPQALEGFLEPF